MDENIQIYKINLFIKITNKYKYQNLSEGEQ